MDNKEATNVGGVIGYAWGRRGGRKLNLNLMIIEIKETVAYGKRCPCLLDLRWRRKLTDVLHCIASSAVVMGGWFKLRCRIGSLTIDYNIMHFNISSINMIWSPLYILGIILGGGGY